MKHLSDRQKNCILFMHGSEFFKCFLSGRSIHLQLLFLKPRCPPCPSARSQAGWDLKDPESVLDCIPGGLHREPSRRRPDRFRFNRRLWNMKERQSAQSSELLTSSLRVNRESSGRKEILADCGGDLTVLVTNQSS